VQCTGRQLVKVGYTVHGLKHIVVFSVASAYQVIDDVAITFCYFQ
jgi:hypothetical protein